MSIEWGLPPMREVGNWQEDPTLDAVCRLHREDFTRNQIMGMGVRMKKERCNRQIKQKVKC